MTRLDLANNLLATLPTELGNLTQLKVRRGVIFSFLFPIQQSKCAGCFVSQELVLEGNPLQTPFDHIRREPYGDLAVIQFLHVDIGELDLTGASIVEVRMYWAAFGAWHDLNILPFSDSTSASPTFRQLDGVELE